MTYNLAPRRRFNQAQRDAFLHLHGHACYWRREPIVTDEWDIEHVIARELMPDKNADDDSNLKPIHRKVCHPKKTALDRKLIAKSNRIRRANGPVELRRKTKPIPSRPNAWPKRTMSGRKKNEME